MNSESLHFPFNFPRIHINAVLVLGIIIIVALLSFELFNYTTTEYALADLLGGLTFLGLRWSTILSIAFCGIDFAGIARLFITGQDVNEPKEVWYLFGAWILAAAMNAALTWWGVSIAVLNHPVQSSVVMDSATMVKIVPVFVAIMIWVIRVLIIGTISTAGSSLIKGGRRSCRWFIRSPHGCGPFPGHPRSQQCQSGGFDALISSGGNPPGISPGDQSLNVFRQF